MKKYAQNTKWLLCKSGEITLCSMFHNFYLWHKMHECMLKFLQGFCLSSSTQFVSDFYNQSHQRNISAHQRNNLTIIANVSYLADDSIKMQKLVYRKGEAA